MFCFLDFSMVYFKRDVLEGSFFSGYECGFFGLRVVDVNLGRGFIVVF